MPLHIVLYVLSFIGIWFGAGLIISSVEKFSHKLRLSPFSVSFIVLGFFTSLGEMSVGVNAVLNNDPEIFAGNIIGASIVIFLLIIPLLAITGKSVKINPEFQKFNLITSLVVIGLPVILCLDGKIDKVDGLICLGMFIFSTLLIQSKKGFLQKTTKHLQLNIKTGTELLKILFGVVIVYFCSDAVVDQTMYFSQLLSISPFFISLMLVSIGTNLPELSLVIRSIFFKNNEVAFGDYVGSASYNTLIFGALTIWYGKTIFLTNSYVISLVALIIGLFLFFLFAKSKNTLSRLEGFYLFCLYLVFVGVEFFLHFT
ncbi:MAG TPA: hypothetical protein VLH94_02885 [Spirochaetia bacterium]|nr:hypothetical protein [Spirochaetia bacterium]